MRSLMNKCLNIRTIGKMTNQVSSTYECSTEERTRTLWNIHSPIFTLRQCETQREDHLCEVSIKHSGLHNEYNHKKSEIDDNSPCLHDFCVGFRNLRKMGFKF